MKYRITKRRYLDSIFILLIGTIGVICLTLYIKPPVIKPRPPIKPVISIAATNRFLYVSNATGTSSASIFHTDTLKDEPVYSTTAGEISNAVLINNHFLFLHGTANTGINIDTKKTFPSNGDYISPDGKKFITIDTSTTFPSFSLLDNQNHNSLIATQSQLGKILGWSPDSNNFYYTVPYAITKQASMSATDHWMQKFGKDMKPMSRIRTWVVYSTSSAISVFKIDTQTKTASKILTDSNIDTIDTAFYDNKRDELYLINESGMYKLHPSDTQATKINIPPKTAASIASLIFSQDPNIFVYSDGTAIHIEDPRNSSDRTIFYASQSATVNPVVFTDNKLIFSLINDHSISGEMIDVNRLVRTEFFHTILSSENMPVNPLLFVAWLKDITVSF